jgi:hypothetical protein
MNPNPRSRRAGRALLIALATLAAATTASAEWKEQVLYSFQGGTSDGAGPAGGVVFDKAGNLYGATTGGGPASCAPIGNECGLVYQLSPPVNKGDAWTETIIYQFQGKGSNDASAPAGGVILDAVGNVYGTTAYGGTGSCVLLGVLAGCGTVFELSPPQQKGGAWTESILYSFQSGNDGYFPWGTLTFDSKGNLYGATYFGGGKGNTCNVYYEYCGTVFKLSPPKQKSGKWTEQVLHSFAGSPDGANPNGGLIMDKQGVIYGTTQTGGNQGCIRKDTSVGCGTLFDLRPPAKKGGVWTAELLHAFAGGNDGAVPNGDLIFDKHGAVYGTGFKGGTQQFGLVFQFIPKKGGRWTENVLHNFSGRDGRNPVAGLFLESSGDLCGTASGGGAAGGGTAFLLKRAMGDSNWAFNLIHTFTANPDGEYPGASLILDKRGHLLSTTLYGGTSQGGQICGSYGCGTAFELSP